VALRVIVGAQWGDEGKGKIVDVLSERADVVARHQGGPNAGHTVVVDGRTYIFHLLPAGVIRPGKTCVIGNGVVLAPETFLKELDQLRRGGISVEGRLFVSERAHIITPYHLALEAAEEGGSEGGRIGTTRRGVGPAYRDKIARFGIRAIDLVHEVSLRESVARNLAVTRRLVGHTDSAVPGERALVEQLSEFGQKLRPFMADISVMLNDALRRGDEVLAEGAQGTLLDIDHGTYPYVTSSNSVAGGACTGLGIGPTAVDEVIGVAKAYSTRVGKGPFPTELPPEQAAALREAGEEYGATTGRPRRCGWFDAVALRHAVRVNGMSSLIITKLDVLDNLDEIEVCTAYELDGVQVEALPARAEEFERCRPVYQTVQGWKAPVRQAKSWKHLPARARDYLSLLSDLVGVPLSAISVGSSRDETVTCPSQ
jgi:adenylosuccinate synthase